MMNLSTIVTAAARGFAVATLCALMAGPAAAAGELLNDPFFPVVRNVEVDGRVLVWAELGDPKGRPLVFAVGFPHAASAGAGLLSPFDGFLHRNGIRLVAVERTGATNRSTFTPDDTLDDYVSDVERLTAHLGIDRFAVMGYSAGGPGALALAAKMPERVTSVHLVSARGRYTDELAPRTGEQRFYEALIEDPFAFAPAFESFPPPRFLFDPRDIAFLDRNFGEVFLDFYIGTSLEELDQNPRGLSASRAIGYQPWSFTLADVVAPVFIYQGWEDQIILPTGFAQDTPARVTGVATVRFYPGEAHIETHLHHFDQVILDMKHLGTKVVMCGRDDDGDSDSDKGRSRTRSVKVSQVRDLLQEGYIYGDCVWQ